jgi:hypothetical protein
VIWNSFSIIVRLLFWVGLVTALSSSLGSERISGKAHTLSDGRIEFAPHWLTFWGSLLIAFYFAYLSIARVRNHHEIGFDLLIAACIGAFSLTIAFSLPGTITVTTNGVNQSFWLRKNKVIHWEEIVEVNTGEKSRTVTITGKNGTKILHSRQLPDRPRLLLEIKQHSGENLPPDFPREPV